MAYTKHIRGLSKMDYKSNELLKAHLEKNPMKWDEFIKKGHKEGTRVRLSFNYFCSNPDDAEMLRSFFITDTDFDVEISKKNEFWSLAGNTLDTDISLDLLNSWVEWMVKAGFKYQCVFDNWEFIEEK